MSGFSDIKNGSISELAEKSGFFVMVTTEYLMELPRAPRWEHIEKQHG